MLSSAAKPDKGVDTVTNKVTQGRELHAKQAPEGDPDVSAKRANLAAARARFDHSLHEFSDSSRTLWWRTLLPLACGAVLGGVTGWLLRGRKPRSFTLVQITNYTAPAPQPPAVASNGAWKTGAKLLLPHVLT